MMYGTYYYYHEDGVYTLLGTQETEAYRNAVSLRKDIIEYESPCLHFGAYTHGPSVGLEGRSNSGTDKELVLLFSRLFENSLVHEPPFSLRRWSTDSMAYCYKELLEVGDHYGYVAGVYHFKSGDSLTYKIGRNRITYFTLMWDGSTLTTETTCYD